MRIQFLLACSGILNLALKSANGLAAWRNRAPRLALALALGFPTGFVLLFAVAVAAFA